MVITVLHEAGSAEGFDKTIAYNLETYWTPGNTNSETPKFYSASGTNVSHSWPKTFGTNEVHCNLEDQEFLMEIANSDTWHRVKAVVYIDVFARDAALGKLFVKEVNRIFWDQLKPNGSNRVKKSDGTSNSAIAEFGKTEIQWIKEKFLHPQNSLYVHYSGQLEIIYYKTRT